MSNKLLIRKLQVFTDSGYYLGRLKAMELEKDSNLILHYVVVRGCWRFKKIFLIHPRQVLKITNKKIVVQDTVTTIPSLKEVETASSVVG